MHFSLLTAVTAVLAAVPTVVFAAPTAAPAAEADPTLKGLVTIFPALNEFISNRLGKQYPSCNKWNIKVRKDFDSMQKWERKAYTDAVNCLMTKPSRLDQTLYPAATNRFMDYAVVHVNRTSQAHLTGYFLTWHRWFLHIYEQDLQQQCGYTGSFPYWNWPATANNLTGSAVFDGSAYSMSGNGEFVNGTGPIVLSPTLQIPRGTGGGCVKNGPFAGMNTTMAPIPAANLVRGLPLPPTAFQKNISCLTRDLNPYAAQTWCNKAALDKALAAPNISDFSNQINGVIGGSTLGLHSGAHFIVGSPASSIYVSPMDPIWYPLHAMLDNLYTSWQRRHPDIATQVYGTETALNIPPSANVTLSSIEPDISYFSNYKGLTVAELMSTTSGPFCYKYDVDL